MMGGVSTETVSTETVSTETVSTETFEQYALIIGRDGGVPLCVVYVMSRLNSWFYDIMSPLLKNVFAKYMIYGPRLARAYHCKLIANPIEYTGRALRTIPILNLLGYEGGLLILNSDPPLFSPEFLAHSRPALINICFLTNKPIPFYYKIGVRNRGTLRSGYVSSDDYTALEPYSQAEISSVQARGIDEIPIETLMPGRYFVDLSLELDINPVLFAEGLFHIDDILLLAAYHLVWQDAGDHLEPSLVPNIRVIIDNFTHIIAHFKTTPAALIDADIYRTSLKDARKFSVITEPGRNRVPRRVQNMYGVRDDTDSTDDTDSNDDTHDTQIYADDLLT